MMCWLQLQILGLSRPRIRSLCWWGRCKCQCSCREYGGWRAPCSMRVYGVLLNEGYRVDVGYSVKCSMKDIWGNHSRRQLDHQSVCCCEGCRDSQSRAKTNYTISSGGREVSIFGLSSFSRLKSVALLTDFWNWLRLLNCPSLAFTFLPFSAFTFA